MSWWRRWWLRWRIARVERQERELWPLQQPLKAVELRGLRRKLAQLER